MSLFATEYKPMDPFDHHPNTFSVNFILDSHKTKDPVQWDAFQTFQQVYNQSRQQNQNHEPPSRTNLSSQERPQGRGHIT